MTRSNSDGSQQDGHQRSGTRYEINAQYAGDYEQQYGQSELSAQEQQHRSAQQALTLHMQNEMYAFHALQAAEMSQYCRIPLEEEMAELEPCPKIHKDAREVLEWWLGDQPAVMGAVGPLPYNARCLIDMALDHYYMNGAFMSDGVCTPIFYMALKTELHWYLQWHQAVEEAYHGGYQLFEQPQITPQRRARANVVGGSEEVDVIFEGCDAEPSPQHARDRLQAAIDRITPCRQQSLCKFRASCRYLHEGTSLDFLPSRERDIGVSSTELGHMRLLAAVKVDDAAIDSIGQDPRVFLPLHVGVREAQRLVDYAVNCHYEPEFMAALDMAERKHAAALKQTQDDRATLKSTELRRRIALRRQLLKHAPTIKLIATNVVIGHKRARPVEFDEDEAQAYSERMRKFDPAWQPAIEAKPAVVAVTPVALEDRKKSKQRSRDDDLAQEERHSETKQRVANLFRDIAPLKPGEKVISPPFVVAAVSTEGESLQEEATPSISSQSSTCKKRRRDDEDESAGEEGGSATKKRREDASGREVGSDAGFESDHSLPSAVDCKKTSESCTPSPPPPKVTSPRSTSPESVVSSSATPPPPPRFILSASPPPPPTAPAEPSAASSPETPKSNAPPAANFPPTPDPPVGVRLSMDEYREAIKQLRQPLGRDERRRLRSLLEGKIKAFGVDDPDPEIRARIYKSSRGGGPAWDTC